MEAVHESGTPGRCTAAVQMLETTPLDTTKLDEILPKRFKHHIVQYEELGNSDHFKAEIRVNIFCKEEALEWVQDFEELTGTNFRTRKTFKENSHKLIFKKLYRCHKNTFVPKAKVVKRPSERNVGCHATLCITVKNNKMKWSSDTLLRDYPCIIGLRHDHCHSLTTPDTLRYRRPLPELKEKFAALFAEKISPSTALKIHKLDLQRQYGDKYNQVVLDSAKCPQLHWVYKLYYTLYQKGVKEGRRKASKKASLFKKIKIKESSEKNLSCRSDQVFVFPQGVCEQLINDVDISIISETRELVVASTVGNGSFSHFGTLNSSPNDGIKKSIVGDSGEYVLFEDPDSRFVHDSVEVESYDHTTLQSEGEHIEEVDDEVHVGEVVEVQIEDEEEQPGELDNEEELEEAVEDVQMEEPVDEDAKDAMDQVVEVQVDVSEFSNVPVESADLCFKETNVHNNILHVVQSTGSVPIKAEMSSDAVINSAESICEPTHELISSVERVFCDVKNKLRCNPQVFFSAVQIFVSKYEQLSNTSDINLLASALENFGHRPTAVNAIANLTRTLDSGQSNRGFGEFAKQHHDSESRQLSPKKNKVILVKLTEPPLKRMRPNECLTIPLKKP